MPTPIPPALSTPHRIARGLGITGLFMLLALLGACKAKDPVAPPPPAVTVARPVQQDVTDYLNASGQLASPNAVNLMARVQGYLEAISYRDGELVEKGKPLFSIEPTSYRAQLDQAKANLASATAKAAFSEQQYRRYAELDKTDSTSRQQLEQMRANRQADQAAVLQAKAAVAVAQTTFGYTRVTAPFDGFVTAHQANVGQLVGNSQPTQLATILQLDPIWVQFNISEQDALRLRQASRNAGVQTTNLHHTPIEIALQNEADYPHRGTIDYVSPQIDVGTGTLAVRGTFANPSHALLPGNFVRIRIPLGTIKGALLVPGSAIRTDQAGRTVFVVNTAGVVESRPVTLGLPVNDLQMILSGLKPSDRVIISGLQATHVGDKVHPLEVAPSVLARNTGDTP